MVKNAKLSDLRQDYKIGLMLNQIALTMTCDLIASLNETTSDEILQIFTQKAMEQLKTLSMSEIDNFIKAVENVAENTGNKGDVLSCHIKLNR